MDGLKIKIQLYDTYSHIGGNLKVGRGLVHLPWFSMYTTSLLRMLYVDPVQQN